MSRRLSFGQIVECDPDQKYAQIIIFYFQNVKYLRKKQKTKLVLDIGKLSKQF